MADGSGSTPWIVFPGRGLVAGIIFIFIGLIFIFLLFVDAFIIGETYTFVKIIILILLITLFYIFIKLTRKYKFIKSFARDISGLIARVGQDGVVVFARSVRARPVRLREGYVVAAGKYTVTVVKRSLEELGEWAEGVEHRLPGIDYSLVARGSWSGYADLPGLEVELPGRGRALLLVVPPVGPRIGGKRMVVESAWGQRVEIKVGEHCDLEARSFGQGKVSLYLVGEPPVSWPRVSVRERIATLERDGENIVSPLRCRPDRTIVIVTERDFPVRHAVEVIGRRVMYGTLTRFKLQVVMSKGILGKQAEDVPLVDRGL